MDYTHDTAIYRAQDEPKGLAATKISWVLLLIVILFGAGGFITIRANFAPPQSASSSIDVSAQEGSVPLVPLRPLLENPSSTENPLPLSEPAPDQ